MNAAVALQAVLGLLAAYHVGIGILSITSLRLTAAVTTRLYGLALAETPALRYAVRMLGLYALTLGTLLALAVRTPAQHRELIAVVAALQLARAMHRLLLHAELAAAFGVTARRNRFDAALLIAEAAVLLACLPALSR